MIAAVVDGGDLDARSLRALAPSPRPPPAPCSRPPGSAPECNQHIDQSLNNARYHELGGGYSLGMVLCWLGTSSESQILFHGRAAAPAAGRNCCASRNGAIRVSSRPTCWRWRNTSRHENDHQLSALWRQRRVRRRRRMDLDRQRIQDDRLLGQAGLQRRQRIRPQRPLPGVPAEEITGLVSRESHGSAQSAARCNSTRPGTQQTRDQCNLNAEERALLGPGAPRTARGRPGHGSVQGADRVGTGFRRSAQSS